MEFSTDEMREKLILEIENFPCLYDSSKESYHIKQAKSNAWSKVAEACGCHGKEDTCKLVWKRLKDKFKREKEKMANSRSGDAATASKVWNLYHAMSFVAPFFQPRETRSNLMLGCQKTTPTNSLLEENQTESTLEGVIDFTGENNDTATDLNGTTTHIFDAQDNVVHISAEPSPCPSTSSLNSLTDVRGECTGQVQPYRRAKNRKRKAHRTLNESLDLDTQAQTILDVMKNDASKDTIEEFYISLAGEMRCLKRTKRIELRIQFMKMARAALIAAENDLN